MENSEQFPAPVMKLLLEVIHQSTSPTHPPVTLLTKEIDGYEMFTPMPTVDLYETFTITENGVQRKGVISKFIIHQTGGFFKLQVIIE